MNSLFNKKAITSKLLVIVCGFMIAISLSSCSRKTDQSDTTTQSGETYRSSTATNTIGTSTNDMMTTNNPTMEP